MRPLRALGVDPGLTVTGYGVVEAQGSRLRLLDFGAVKTSADRPLAERLHSIYSVLDQVLVRWKPDAGAIEEVFLQRNFQSAVKIAHVRAAAMVACNVHQVPVFEYSATAMKKALVGYGQAEKAQVQLMVQKLLGLLEPPRPLDAADALGHAICHLQHVPWLRQMEALR
jgi:crossover junction endodeoxyribonuclease RuvC